ncbi:MAG TPA: UvrD-helicase domain-containing protein [Solirubrobacterales bacterium]|nr:UvrD-helicase domain-containing protein [Solirubrobacterales bacterium]
MSETRAPTPEQAAAISARGDTLVEAGAGTGKTGVMVDRYCRLVCEEGVSPDAVLAFTFTDKAADELRQRIRAALALRAKGGSERARELLAGIGGAWVTTIHGFCNRLLAGHPVAAGVDPRFRVLDAAEAQRVAQGSFDEALEDFLAGGDRPRERTVAAFDVGGLRAMIFGVHAELRSRGVAEPRLPEPPPADPDGALRRAAETAATTLEELKPTNSNRELVERAIEVLGDGAGARPGLDELAALRSYSSAHSMAAYREALDAAVAATAEAGEGGEAYRHVAELLELFSLRFDAAKEARAAIDFEDLQILAASLLERSEVGAAYRGRFTHLLVDEFQDTNRLQLRLIEALRGASSELVVVGDELQSIYGFRHADLDVFREQRAAIEAGAGAEAMALSGNFRSRPELIGAVNALGEKLLSESFRPLTVGALPAKEQPAGDGAAVELLLTGRDGWDAEGIGLEPATDATTPPNLLAEARTVAARLRDLADAGVERGAMVVLLRAFTHLDAYEDSLERAGLRPYVVGGRGYWSQQQVADVCALLATIANPLDDQALFGALASPACGAAPDTLWLLRAAAGRGRHVWPALERVAGREEAELDDPDRLETIPEPELALLRSFTATLEGLRERAPRLPLADLIDAAVSETGYDLAVLTRPAGEARFANVRKLMRLAAEFEAAEGRDLRGLLDFLASRADADADAQAATAVEGHDGVRIMTVHSAKGLEFDVVAVPGLSRRLLAGARAPLLAVGRESESPRVGMQLRRLGAAAINLYANRELREEAQRRDAEEELRLFHVAATRARERLILSGVAKPEAGGKNGPGTPVIERILDGFGIDREQDSTVAIPAPEPRQGLETSFAPSAIAVRITLASPDRAAELTARRHEEGAAPEPGEGPAPLLERRPPTVPNRPLSYTALAAYDECAYRFYMERVLDLRGSVRVLSRIPRLNANSPAWEAENAGRDEGAARGAAVHSLLEWSQTHGWQEPPADLVRDHALAAGYEPEEASVDQLLVPVRDWLGSSFLRDRVLNGGGSVRAEVPLLLNVAGTVLRGSIDLLVERDGEPPLVLDYKTDRLNGTTPAERAAGYATQRDVYALAVAEARRAREVEVAYVFLERPEDPVVQTLGAAEMEAGRLRLEETIARIARGEFPPAPAEDRDWALCEGCPALGRLCSGPRHGDPEQALPSP